MVPWQEEVVAYVPDREQAHRMAGAFYLKPNWPGRANDVANAGFIVAPEWRNNGLGRLLGTTMLEYARRIGFRSVIFNLVFSENQAARGLWEQLGFRPLGVIPGGVRKNEGPTRTRSSCSGRSWTADDHALGRQAQPLSLRSLLGVSSPGRVYCFFINRGWSPPYNRLVRLMTPTVLLRLAVGLSPWSENQSERFGAWLERRTP